MGDGYVYVANQEDFIKTKNITEKIDFNGLSILIWYKLLYILIVG